VIEANRQLEAHSFGAALAGSWTLTTIAEADRPFPPIA